MKPVRVLVTGAGSGVGQGIIKSLRISNYPITIISSDISPFNSALYRTDEAIIIPKVEDSGALELIVALINENNINIVMVGSEFDLMFFSKNKNTIHNKTGAQVIVSNPNVVAIANDKWLTAEFLRENDLPYAESFISNNIDSVVDKATDWGFPIVVKARTGTSSHDVFIINNTDNLVKKWVDISSPMLQRAIDIPSSELNNEYTCSLFKTSKEKILGPFIARRTLRGGTSWLIEAGKFSGIEPILLRIGSMLDFEGSLNIQLMVGTEGPVPFEINARFSGTTAVRAHFGFNEPELAIQSFFYGEEPINPLIRSGIAMRYHEEVFIDNVSSDCLTVNKDKGVRREWF
jgi:carbamoyl-phosphate synthase large subunit